MARSTHPKLVQSTMIRTLQSHLEAEEAKSEYHGVQTLLYHAAALDKPHLLTFPIKDTAALLSYGTCNSRSVSHQGSNKMI